MKDPVIILLAAGSSSRMGQSKQLIKIGDESLIVQTTKHAIQSGMRTIVVLGANEMEHRIAIEKLSADIIKNTDWKTGMGSSLKAGLKYILENDPDVEAIIVAVCDQPLLTSHHLVKLKDLHQSSRKSIVASYYSGTEGVPTLFHKILFTEILNLSDDQGAKKIIQRHPDETITVQFPEGATDLDTPEDLIKFTQELKNRL